MQTSADDARDCRAEIPRVADWVLARQVPVILGRTEAQIARKTAQCRFENAQRTGLTAITVENGQRVNRDDWKPSKQYWNGMHHYGAELAGAKLLDCYPDLTVGVRNQYDYILADGRTADAKHAYFRDDKLLVSRCNARETRIKEYDEFADVFVLVAGFCPKYWVAGYTDRERLIDAERINHKMAQPCYAMRQEELCDIRDLLNAAVEQQLKTGNWPPAWIGEDVGLSNENT